MKIQPVEKKSSLFSETALTNCQCKHMEIRTFWQKNIPNIVKLVASYQVQTNILPESVVILLRQRLNTLRPSLKRQKKHEGRLL